MQECYASITNVFMQLIIKFPNDTIYNVSITITVKGRVAQSVEHSPANQEVPGSIPVYANSAYE